MIVYIDALALLFRSYYAVQGLQARDGMPTGALYGMTSSVFRIIDELRPKDVIACFDGPERTIRQEASDEYKANREDAEEDMVAQLEVAASVLQAYGIHTVSKKGHEADDLLGTLAVKDADDGEEVVIVTCDGDLLQMTTHENIRVYYLQRGVSDFVFYDKKSVEKKNGYPAKHIVDFKGLAGDSSDNIKGVKGIGAVFAKRLINKYGGLEGIYGAVEAGKLKEDGFTDRVANLLVQGKEDAFFSRDLATIHTDLTAIRPHMKSKPWSERISMDDARKTLERYNFNSLIGKLERLTRTSNEPSNAATGNEIASPEASPELKKRAAIALWVLDATQTNATAEEVASYTGESNLQKALEKIEKQLKGENRLQVWTDIEEPLISVLERVERHGIAFDLKQCRKLTEEYKEKIAKFSEQIHGHAGEEFNINSPKQLSEVLYGKLGLKPEGKKRTASGVRTTREAVLLEMRGQHPIVDLILEYRHYEKLRSTYTEALPNFLDEKGRIHTHLRQNGTTTGRLTSVNPNLQNIPVGGEDGRKIRNLFVASEGHELLAADYSQMEMRTAAILSNDEQMIGIFLEKADLHLAVASRVLGIDEKDVTLEQRNRAKAINFGILYGMGAQSLKRATGSTFQEAKEFLETYKKAFPKLFLYLDGVKKGARENGFVTTAFGRVRPIEGIHSSLPFVRAQAERIAINAPIQGTSADIIKKAMIAIHGQIEKENAQDDVRMILQIHDELLFEIKKGKVQQWGKRIKDSMEAVFPENHLPIKMVVGVESGKSWGQLKR